MAKISEAISDVSGKCKAKGTLATYMAIRRKFSLWTRRQGIVNESNEETRNLFLCHLWSQKKFGQISTARAALNFRFGPLSGKGAEVAKLIVDAAARSKPPLKSRNKLKVQDLWKLVNKTPDSPSGLRFAVFILLGFFGMLRVSEILALEWSDLQVETDYIILSVRKSKTDQFSEGAKVRLDWDRNSIPRKKLLLWKSVCRGVNVISNILDGSTVGQAAMSNLFKKACRNAKITGMTPHGLRGGGATYGLQIGKDPAEVMRIGRWKSWTSFKLYVDGTVLPSINIT